MLSSVKCESCEQCINIIPIQSILYCLLFMYLIPTKNVKELIKSMKIYARAIYYILRVIHYKKWNEHLFSNMSCDISKHRQMGPGNQFPVSKSGSSTLTDARMTSYNKSNFRFMWYINTYINWAMKFTFEFKNSFWVLWPMRLVTSSICM